ncbi:HepT-like ribonuclease domain-containing protein [Sulfurimonas sp. NWX367]|uniref:HepT-like ribonuclease domain-containing protein n=1 Tax=Sulfurimonas sp. NWX367 TaxID=2925413 RepID=UPI003204FA1A
MSKESISKVYLIIEKIDYIEQTVKKAGGVVKALEDVAIYRAAILMHLTAIAEQFNKLKQSHSNEILSNFEDKDLKGMYDVRTYIAHDYEGVNLAIIEWIIRNALPKFKTECENIIKNYSQN